MSLTDDMDFLSGMADAVLEASRVRPEESVAGAPANATGGTLIRPGGRDCYPAFWIRDYAMSLECGRIPADEQLHALRLTARCQARQDWHTPSGSLVPRGAIADHITFDAQPIYFPGTNDFATQGQPWGYYPSLDDHYFFVEMAWSLARTHGDGGRALLDAPIDGIRLIDRLGRAFAVPPVDSASGLVRCDEATRGVTFGFTDSIVHTGSLLFCSVLRQRAAVQLADLLEACGQEAPAAGLRSLAASLRAQIGETFADGSGWLRASTGRSAQRDVWGSAFAVAEGAVDPATAEGVCHALRDALARGTIAWRGSIRHVPTDADFSEAGAWEMPVNATFTRNRYQNGAYWSTPTGWVCLAVAQVDPDAARELASAYVAELREGDFRQGDTFGSPYECRHPDGDHRQNPVYLTSVTCPLAAFQRLGWMG